MKTTIKLTNPVLIDGKSRSEFECDPEEITVDQFDKIEALCAAGRKPNELVMAEFDSTRHRYVAMMAIVAVNPDVDIEDLRRIKGVKDLEGLRDIGRNFTLGISEDELQENDSENMSEIIADTSTKAPQKPEK